MTAQIERVLVRILIGAALCVALIVSFLISVPEDATGNPNLPAIAFGQAGIYRLEVALLVFYGALLLMTPTFSGLTRGRLPTEISARGAKFAEEADQSGSATEAAIRELRQNTSDLTAGLTAVDLEIDELRGMLSSDSTQPKVDSSS